MELEQPLKSILGEECWLIIAGTGTGSVVSLGFGERKTRNKSIKNPNLLEEEKKYDSKMRLMIYCAWRLSSSDHVICGWRDSNEKNGPMLKGLNLLRNSRVLSVKLDPINYDLKICFNNGLIFEIFCDITNIDEGDDNYCFFLENEIYEIGFQSKVIKNILNR